MLMLRSSDGMRESICLQRASASPLKARFGSSHHEERSTSSPLERIRPRFQTEVLSQKAREAIRTVGYTDEPRDEAYGFRWDGDLIDHVAAGDKPSPKWDAVLSQRPSPLIFWYRQSLTPMAGKRARRWVRLS